MATRTKPAVEPLAPPEELSEQDAAKVLAEAQRIFYNDGVYLRPDGEPLGLYERLARIIDSLPEVRPEGKNEHFKYSFVTDKQVLGLVRPRLATQRIIVYPETVTEQPFVELTTQKGGRSLLTRLHVVFRVVDGITGESFTGEAVGYGDDAGDKGANKAYTAALKNFFIKLFLMGGADRDIEDDPETDRRARARETGVEPVREVEVKETTVEAVSRGGRSTTATKPQVDAVSRLVQALGIGNPDDFAKIVERVLGDPIEFNNWPEVRKYLEHLPGTDIGKVIEAMSEMEERLNDAPYG